jgi:hypothetical protein
MRWLLSFILIAVGCNNTQEIDLKETKWQLFSMSADTAHRMNDMDKLMMESFAQDTSHNKVFVNFNSDTSMQVFINSSKPMNPTGIKYNIKKDTVFLEGPEAKQKDTFLISSYSKDFLNVYSPKGIEYKLKRVK